MPIKETTNLEKTSVGAPQDEEEKAFLKAHRRASFWSSFFFGLASAAYFGALSAFGMAFVSSSEKKAINNLKVSAGETIPEWDSAKLFKNPQTPQRLAGMIAAGSAFLFISNWLETKKTLLEWRMGGSKIGRKFEMAANDAEETAKMPRQKTPPIVAEEIPECIGRADGKSWVEASRGSSLIPYQMHP